MWGADSDQAKQAWREYQEAKEEANAVMLKKLNETNKKRMQDLGRGAERNKNMFRELKNWMDKGKGKEELVEFLTEEGEVIKNEDDILAEIEKVWGALVWNENVRKNVERMQNEYGRWMWRLKRTVRNTAVHGESGWSSFWERKVKEKVSFVVRVLEEDGLVAKVGRACFMGIGVRSKWRKKIGRMTEELGVDVLSNLAWLRRMSAIGVAEMGICEDDRKRMRKVELERKAQEVGRLRWEEQLQRNERTRRYAQEKGWARGDRSEVDNESLDVLKAPIRVTVLTEELVKGKNLNFRCLGKPQRHIRHQRRENWLKMDFELLFDAPKMILMPGPHKEYHR
ncbi:hypothetical protein CAPTEDRAFT_187138 [Capitella teleta]|uniref:Uncharacterized protein n=1 Tax=Capitella teleta TaxID=283909 RepID=R7VHA4_CAPTE|nr:hypothetical protein CAPTEDRAFT_187138 [Capitella teleta]|eukprot:ELU15661.1 hypothetical protein CAPTEDRAFT_187138 [Capitella teleta]